MGWCFFEMASRFATPSLVSKGVTKRDTLENSLQMKWRLSDDFILEKKRNPARKFSVLNPVGRWPYVSYGHPSKPVLQEKRGAIVSHLIRKIVESAFSFRLNGYQNAIRFCRFCVKKKTSKGGSETRHPLEPLPWNGAVVLPINEKKMKGYWPKLMFFLIRTNGFDRKCNTFIHLKTPVFMSFTSQTLCKRNWRLTVDDSQNAC